MAFCKHVRGTMKRMSVIFNPLQASTSIPRVNENYWHNHNHNNNRTRINNINSAIRYDQRQHETKFDCNANWMNKSHFDASNEWTNINIDDYHDEEEQEDFDLDFLLSNAFKEKNGEKLCKDIDNTYVNFVFFLVSNKLYLFCFCYFTNSKNGKKRYCDDKDDCHSPQKKRRRLISSRIAGKRNGNEKEISNSNHINKNVYFFLVVRVDGIVLVSFAHF